MIHRKLETQQLWDWRVAAYLFLAGTGSGCTLVAAICAVFFDSYSLLVSAGMAIGPLLVILGCLFLFLDLGRPLLSFLAARRPGHSWVSRGFVILCAYIILGWVHSAVWTWPWQIVEKGSSTWILLGTANGILALLTAIYTALLLGSSPVPFWNTPILPVLFLTGSLSSGIAAILLVSVYLLGLNLPSGEISFLLQVHGVFILLEMLLVILYLHGMKLSLAAKASAAVVLGGRLAPLFWIGLVLIGLVVPLISERFEEGTFVAAFCTLIGGYLLRHIIIMAGIKMPLSVQGIIIPIPGKN